MRQIFQHSCLQALYALLCWGNNEVIPVKNAVLQIAFKAAQVSGCHRGQKFTHPSCGVAGQALAAWTSTTTSVREIVAGSTREA